MEVKSPVTTRLPSRPYSVPALTRERLPFRVRFVDSAQDLEKAVEIRSSAYARHVPSVGAALRKPETDDYRRDVLILLAERKIDGQPVGSVRLQTNVDQPLRIEGELKLPDVYSNRRLIEAMRLGVTNGISGKLVNAALLKAAYEICHACKIDYSIAAGRRSVAEIYRWMQFDDVLHGGTIPLSYADHLPHGVFAMPIRDFDRRWRSVSHSLYPFFASTEHPDIDIDYERVFRAFRIA